MRDPIELTRRYATTVDELGEAFDFILEHRPLVGERPNIEIQSVTVFSHGEITEYNNSGQHRFGVVVSGMEVQG